MASCELIVDYEGEEEEGRCDYLHLLKYTFYFMPVLRLKVWLFSTFLVDKWYTQ